MAEQPQPHFLLVTYPAQGHINPALQFAKRLVRIGARVTFATCISAHRRMTKTSNCTPDGLSLAAFSDGYDDGFNPRRDDPAHYMSEMKRNGTQTLTQLILDNENDGQPFTCLVNTLLLPWAAEVAHRFQLPSALLWIQPATVFDIYYYYFHGYGDIIKQRANEASFVIELPGLPPLTTRDLPSFLLPSSKYPHALPTFREQMDNLNQESNPIILVNSFDALEVDALKAIDKFKMIAIGPLIPSAFLDGKDPSDTSFGADLFRCSNDYTEWLNSKPKSSVIYVSFGSMIELEKQQMQEIARALLATGHPFLWIIRDNNKNGEEEKEEDKLMSYREELEEQGMIVPWCSQVEVLSNLAVGCFVTHCGWNSTLESLVCGVPVVAFPQWTDQATNAKLIEDLWKTGVRVNTNEEGIAESVEIKRCLELVMEGEKREELRENAKKWSDLAREAAHDGGSSDVNLKTFVDHQVEECFK